MIRLLSAALALACALSTAACNPSDVSAVATVPPTLQPGALSAPALADAGVPTATAAKIADKVSKVQAYARVACGIVPTAETIANLFLASSSTLSTVQGLANVACRALATSGSYTALPGGGDRSGRPVTGLFDLNGHTIRVAGTAVR